MSDFQSRLAPYRKTFAGSFSLHAVRPGNDTTLSWQPDLLMPPASTIKLAAMITAYRQADACQLDLSAHHSVGPTDQVSGSGVLRYLQDTATLTLRDHIRLMIALSDNVATVVVLKAIGVERMNVELQRLHCPNTKLIFPAQTVAGERGRGTCTARELVSLLTGIARHTIASEAACTEMLQHLRCQQYGDQIARYLPFNLYAIDQPQADTARSHAHLRVLNKTGFAPGVRADAGILVLNGEPAVIMSTLTADHADTGYYPDHPGNLMNGIAARLVLEHWYLDELQELSQPSAQLIALPQPAALSVVGRAQPT